MPDAHSILVRSGGFPGSSETYRVAAGAEFVESRYEQSILMKKHAHDTPLLHVVLQGQVSNTSERVTDHAEVAQATYLPAHVPHETLWRGEGKGFAVMFSPAKAEQWSEWGLLPRQPIHLPPGLVSALLVAVRREAFCADAAGIIGADSYLAEALAELMRLPRLGGEKERCSQRLWQARELVSDTYETLPTLDEIARQVELHPVYLARAFRQAFGETVGECLRRRRIEAACRLIARTDLSLTTIAHEVGFADQSHFTRTFKQYLGVPPTDYARAVRPQNFPQG